MKALDDAKQWLEALKAPAPIDPLHSMHWDGELIERAESVIAQLLAAYEEEHGVRQKLAEGLIRAVGFRITPEQLEDILRRQDIDEEGGSWVSMDEPHDDIQLDGRWKLSALLRALNQAAHGIEVKP